MYSWRWQNDFLISRPHFEKDENLEPRDSFTPSKGTLKVIAVPRSAVQPLIRGNTTAIAAADDDCIFAE